MKHLFFKTQQQHQQYDEVQVLFGFMVAMCFVSICDRVLAIVLIRHAAKIRNDTFNTGRG